MRTGPAMTIEWSLLLTALWLGLTYFSPPIAQFDGNTSDNGNLNDKYTKHLFCAHSVNIMAAYEIFTSIQPTVCNFGDCELWIDFSNESNHMLMIFQFKVWFKSHVDLPISSLKIELIHCYLVCGATWPGWCHKYKYKWQIQIHMTNTSDKYKWQMTNTSDKYKW